MFYFGNSGPKGYFLLKDIKNIEIHSDKLTFGLLVGEREYILRAENWEDVKEWKKNFLEMRDFYNK